MWLRYFIITAFSTNIWIHENYTCGNVGSHDVAGEIWSDLGYFLGHEK